MCVNMIWIKFVKSLIKLLHSEISPNEIAGGIALGAMIGLTPVFTIQKIALFMLVLILKVNIGAALFSVAVFALAGLLLDPVSHQLGYLLLAKIQPLTSLWAAMYNMPIVPFTRFYNTVVLGSFVLSLILFVPLFLLSKKLIIKYRQDYRQHVEKWKIVKLLKLTSIYSIYDRYK